MCNTHAYMHIREGGRRPKQTQRENFMFNFSCPALRYKFYFLRLLPVGPDLALGSCWPALLLSTAPIRRGQRPRVQNRVGC